MENQIDSSTASGLRDTTFPSSKVTLIEVDSSPKLPQPGSLDEPARSGDVAVSESWPYATPAGYIIWPERGPSGMFHHHSLSIPRNLPRPQNGSALQTPDLKQGARVFLDLCSGSERPLSVRPPWSWAARSCPLICFWIAAWISWISLFYEDLRHIAGSGVVGYSAASPSCSDYSPIKLDGSPPFVCVLLNVWRAFLTSLVPNFNVLRKAKRCFIVAARSSCWFMAQAVIPILNSRDLLCHGARLVRNPGCAKVRLLSLSLLHAHGRNWAKTWLFATSFRCFASLAATCQHGPNAHPVLPGPRVMVPFIAGKRLNIRNRLQPPLLASLHLYFRSPRGILLFLILLRPFPKTRFTLNLGPFMTVQDGILMLIGAARILRSIWASS